MPDDNSETMPDPNSKEAPPWFKQYRYILLAIAMGISGLVYGYKQLVEAGIWVPRSGIEREHDKLAGEHVNMTADIITVDETAVVKKFPDDVLYMTRMYRVNGGFTYRGCWLPKDYKVQVARPPRHAITPSAYAEPVIPIVMCLPVTNPHAFADTVIEEIPPNLVRMRRVFSENQCAVVIVINKTTGALHEGGKCTCPWE